MKNLNSFFLSKKKVPRKNFQNLKKKNSFLSVFSDKLKKKILEKATLNYLNIVNTHQKNLFFMPALPLPSALIEGQQIYDLVIASSLRPKGRARTGVVQDGGIKRVGLKNKEKIIFTRYSQLRLVYRPFFYISKILSNLLLLLSSNFISQWKSIKIENIINVPNFIQNFKEILNKISQKWKKTLASFSFLENSLNLKQNAIKFSKFEKMYVVFLLFHNFLNKKFKQKKFFFVFCIRNLIKKFYILPFISVKMKNKVYFKENFSSLQNKFLKRKWKFALFFFQIFFKTTNKFFKKSKTKIF